MAPSWSQVKKHFYQKIDGLCDGINEGVFGGANEGVNPGVPVIYDRIQKSNFMQMVLVKLR